MRKSWGPIIAAVVVTVIVSGCSSTSNSDKPSATHSTTAKPKTSVSKGIGAKDASGDVKIGKLTIDPDLKWGSVPITITNSSSKRSNYVITVVAESADGKTRFDEALVLVNDLEPGQKSVEKAQFTKDGIPATAKVVLKEVQRTAA